MYIDRTPLLTVYHSSAGDKKIVGSPSGIRGPIMFGGKLHMILIYHNPLFPEIKLSINDNELGWFRDQILILRKDKFSLW